MIDKTREQLDREIVVAAIALRPCIVVGDGISDDTFALQSSPTVRDHLARNLARAVDAALSPKREREAMTEVVAKAVYDSSIDTTSWTSDERSELFYAVADAVMTKLRRD